jgi:predicted secreted protein
MAIISGTDIYVRLDEVTLVGQVGGNFDLEADMIPTTTKDSTGKAKTYLPGEYGGTVTVNGLYDPDAAEGFSESYANLKAGTVISVHWGQIASGNTYYSSNALIKKVSNGAPKNEAATYNIDIQLTGENTEATV